MDDLILKAVKQLTIQLEQFLRACKAEGDTTIDDVLKRLEELKLNRPDKTDIFLVRASSKIFLLATVNGIW